MKKEKMRFRGDWTLFAIVGLTILAGCERMPNRAATKAAIEKTEANVPLFEGLGGFGRKVTTASPEAQRYFDQGLCFLYAFNHDEAIRAFDQAARIDSDCAMAWWGIALA